MAVLPLSIPRDSVYVRLLQLSIPRYSVYARLLQLSIPRDRSGGLNVMFEVHFQEVLNDTERERVRDCAKRPLLAPSLPSSLQLRAG